MEQLPVSAKSSTAPSRSAVSHLNPGRNPLLSCPVHSFELPPGLAPHEFLAWDEAMLDALEAREIPAALWFWSAPTHWIVVGYGQSCARETHLDRCRSEGVPVLRRCSGGGTVVQGPGCLNYAVCLPIDSDPALASISGANQSIMARQRDALAPLLTGHVAVQGHTDLAWNGRKFSGNAQRRKRSALLFHGTFLAGFDLDLIERWLPFPSAQPGYRSDRRHLDFLVNLPLSHAALREALARQWNLQEGEPPAAAEARLPQLLRDRYADPAWHASR